MGVSGLWYTQPHQPPKPHQPHSTNQRINMKKCPCFEDVSGFNDRWLVATGLPLASIFVSLLLFADAYEEMNWQFLMACIPMSFVYTGVFWWGMRRIYKEVKWRYPDFKQLGRRVVWVFLGFQVLYLVVNFTLDTLFGLLLPQHRGEPNPIVEYIASLILSALVITLYEAISFYVQLQKAVAEKALLERQNIESQLEGLRNQVNPHFLFNSLSILSSLVHVNADLSEQFIEQLARSYRYILEQKDQTLVTLRTELEFIRSYAFLLKIRFDNKFDLQINIADAALDHYRIAPLTLQLLVENAVKHNRMSAKEPLIVSIELEDDFLTVRNPFRPRGGVEVASTGVGLQNITNRYALLSDRSVWAGERGDRFEVRVPLI